MFSRGRDDLFARPCGQAHFLAPLQESDDSVAKASTVHDARPLPLDRGHLERQTFGDEALAREVTQLFLGQSVRLIQIIVGEGGAAGRDAAHTLNGAARAIGAFDVAVTAEAVEAAFGAHADGRKEIEALKSAVERARRAIEQLSRKSGDGRRETS